MKDWKLSLFAALLLAAVPVAAQTHTVLAGDDGWVTQGGGLTTLNLTGWNVSSVFPGGSVVSGTQIVNLKGKPIKPASLGSIDTIVRHTGSHTFTFFGEVRTIPLQIVGLSMVSDSDSVQISGYGTYNVEVYLSTAVAGTGSMSVKQVNGDGGTFSSSFNVIPVVVFQNVSVPADRVRLDCGTVPTGTCGAIVLNSTGTGWVHTGGPGNFNPTTAGVTPLAAGISFDANGDGVNDTTTIGRSNTFIPGFAATPPFNPAGGVHEHADYSARHITKPPQDCLRTGTGSTSTLRNQAGAVVVQPQPQPVLCPPVVAEPVPTDPADPAQPVDGTVN
ncbi:MAG: hypothetical protein ABUT39_18550 [Acidobacteriota bacterium]